jgi:hypothetical protein
MWKRLATWMMSLDNFTPSIGFGANWLAVLRSCCIDSSDKELFGWLSVTSYYLYLPLCYDIIWSTHSGRNGIGNN